LHNYSRSIVDRKGLILRALDTIFAFEDDAASAKHPLGSLIFPQLQIRAVECRWSLGRPNGLGCINAPSPRLSVQVRVNVHVERL
jgi:hypothetical protein